MLCVFLVLLLLSCAAAQEHAVSVQPFAEAALKAEGNASLPPTDEYELRCAQPFHPRAQLTPARLVAAEDLLYGEEEERDVAAAVAHLQELAEHASASPSAAYAAFLLASLQHTGLLSADILTWQPGWEEPPQPQGGEAVERLLGAALSAGLREARIAVATRLLHEEKSCEAALPKLRQVASEVLVEAEAEADHSLPAESVRLRDRHRDGSWQSLRRREAEAAMLDDGECFTPALHFSAALTSTTNRPGRPGSSRSAAAGGLPTACRRPRRAGRRARGGGGV